jgi:hypothetical protein
MTARRLLSSGVLVTPEHVQDEELELKTLLLDPVPATTGTGK